MIVLPAETSPVMPRTSQRAEQFQRGSAFCAKAHLGRPCRVSRSLHRRASRFLGRTLSSTNPSCRLLVRGIPHSHC
ncbi:hypothetical protein M404DRAFT_384541 [Pisolithus tinctorius Marx 270]|uniref:Uncharacterized protein n=1 Tax=Pisolithus tinctorius Marx 270 TaxID=870435 RepID=A0A0C3NF74_PISTI|nr:hypothetical protein M404DRAFT_384541 [Pisolithus tinctorius Marx 270]